MRIGFWLKLVSVFSQSTVIVMSYFMEEFLHKSFFPLYLAFVLSHPLQTMVELNEDLSVEQVVANILQSIPLWASFVISLILTNQKIHSFFQQHLRNGCFWPLISASALVASTTFLYDSNMFSSIAFSKTTDECLTISCLLSTAGAFCYYFSNSLGSYFILYKLAITGGAFFWIITLILISHRLRLFHDETQHCRDLVLIYLLYTLQLIAVYVLVLALKKLCTAEWMYPNQSSSVYIAYDSSDDESEERSGNAANNEEDAADYCDETVDFAHKWKIVGYSHIVKKYIDSEVFYHSDYPETTFFLRLHPRKRYTSLYLHFSSTDLEKVSIWLTCSVVRIGILQTKIVFEKKFKLLTVYSGESIGWYRFIDWEQYTLKHLIHLNCLHIICRIQGFKAEFDGDELYGDSTNRNVEAESSEEFSEPPLDALENID